MQRAYDQLIHDVALQNLNVLFAIDRAGLVGEDGPTHAGSFDLSYLRCIPNLIVMAPSDEAETIKLLNTGFHHHGPAAVRYPRGKGPGASIAGLLPPAVTGEAASKAAAATDSRSKHPPHRPGPAPPPGPHRRPARLRQHGSPRAGSCHHPQCHRGRHALRKTIRRSHA